MKNKRMVKTVMLIALVWVMFACTALAAAPYCIVTDGFARLVDINGADVIPAGSFESTFPVREGALYAVGKRGDYVLVDADGAALSEVHFEMIDDQGDALIYRTGLRYGALNPDGSAAIAAEWTQLTCDGQGGWLALADDVTDEIADRLYHIDADGNAWDTGFEVLGHLSHVSDDRMAVTIADGHMCYVDGVGAPVIPATLCAAGDFEDGRAVVADDDGVYVIDPQGQPVFQGRYAFVCRVGLHFAALDGEGVSIYELADGSLVHVIPGEALAVTPVGDYMAISDASVARLYDELGNILCQVTQQASFAEGIDGQTIVSDGAWGEANCWLVNPDGTAISNRLQRIYPISTDRYAFLEMEGAEYYSELLDETQKSWDYANQRYGLMDGAGNVLLPAAYREIRGLDDDRILMLTDDGIILADRDGQAIRTWDHPNASTGDEGNQ